MDHISYEQFGVNFVNRAVTAERIAEALTDSAGGAFKIGPMTAGPGGIAVAEAKGRAGVVEVKRLPGSQVKFAATLPIVLDLEIKVAAVPQRYRGNIEVSLSLSVHTADPLWLVIEVEPVTALDVDVDLRSEGGVGGMLQRLGNIDEEVRGQVVKVVNERISAPEARSTREIDIAALVDRSMQRDG
jgi:hypothetical protein